MEVIEAFSTSLAHGFESHILLTIIITINNEHDNYKIEVIETYAESKIFLKQVIVILTFKHIKDIAFIDIKNLEGK